VTDPAAFRAQFPVLERVAYLNAGTEGPLPQRAADTVRERIDAELTYGRSGKPYIEGVRGLANDLRDAYARVLGADPADVALTGSTTDGVNTVLGGLSLRPGDEIITSDEEHPGLLGALAAARELSGVSVREVPLPELAEAVGPRTRLVACSHVGWVSGLLAPAELAELEVPVLLDGAQGVGAVPVDVPALGCAAYAGAGQKWCCGPDGTGMLWVAPDFRERIAVSRRGYGNLADPNGGIDARLHEDARRFDTMSLSAEAVACALAAIDLLEAFGWSSVYERARTLAASLADQLAARGRAVAPRDDTTLVSFESADAEAERGVLAERGCVVRSIPGRPWLRASVGAWNDENDLERLLDSLSA